MVENGENVLIKYSLLSITQISDGEVFAYYLQRLPRYPATNPSRELASPKYSWLFPTAIRTLVEDLQEYVGSIEQVMARNTLFPAVVRFLSDENEQLLRKHIIDAYYCGYAGKLGCFNGGSRGRPLWDPGICVECLEQDITASGEPFWRRDFLLSDIHWCARHQAPIYRLCDECTFYFKEKARIDPPSHRCLCGQPLRVRSTTRHVREFDLVSGWSRILDSTFAPNVRAVEIAALTLSQARKVGIVRRDRVDHDMFQQLLDMRRMDSLAQAIGFSQLGGVVKEALKGRRVLSNSLHSLFLLIALYGSWDEVESAIQAPVEPLRSFTAPRTPSITSSERERLAHQVYYAQSLARISETCRLYAELQAQHPELSYMAIRRRLPWINALALTVDRLKAHGVRPKPNKGDTDYMSVLDASAAELVERRASELRENDVPYRITRHRLLHGHPMAWHVADTEILEQIPLTRAALEKNVETGTMYPRRQLRRYVLAGEIANIPPSGADSIQLLSDDDVKSLLNAYQQRRRRQDKKSHA